MRKFSSISKSADIKSVAIGKFDSMHLAHKAILNKLDKDGIVLLIKMPSTSSDFIVPYKKRQDYVQNKIYYVDFYEICDLSGIEFLDFLKDRLPNLGHIIVGNDFKFGKDRAYTAIDIQNISNFHTTIINEMSIDGIPIHSSYIRECILSGNIKLANKLLGRFYSLEGEVTKGQGIGRDLLFPTININVSKYVLPQDGVYASYVKINDDIFKSVVFLGHRFSTNMSFAIEAHIIDEDIANPPHNLEIFFVEKIRDNKRFDNLALLKSQITDDINIAKNVLSTQNLQKIV